MEQFKRVQVVMLPTKNNAVKGDILLRTYADDLKIHSGSLFDIEGGYCKPQHLYITSDDEIKEDDWFIVNNIIKKCVDIKSNKNITWVIDELGNEDIIKFCKKIIATTDTSLNLPQPSQQFIEKYIESYNKSEIITDVLVEYEEINIGPDLKQNLRYYPDNFELKLKINPKDNTITIKKLKDNWNREEIINLLYRVKRNIHAISDENFEKWIEENL